MRILLVLPLLLLSLVSSGQNLSWFHQIGFTGDQDVAGIEYDFQGNMIIYGNFQDSIDLDPTSNTLILKSRGGFNIFFAKYDSIGNLIWGKGLFCTATASIERESLTLDSLGNILLTAAFQDSIDVDPSVNQNYLVTSPSNRSIFFAKYDTNGNLLQSFPFGTGGDITMEGLRIINNHIYISGQLSGSYDFDPGAGTFELFSSLAFNFYIAKYTLTGDLVNAVIFKPSSPLSSNSTSGSKTFQTIDGELIYLGDFKGTIDFDPSGNTFNLSSTATSLFLLKLDTNLNFSMVKKLVQGSSHNYADLLHIESSGDLIITGQFTGTSDFDPDIPVYNLTAPATNCGFIAKYDSIGNFIWAKILANTGGEGAFSTITKKGNHYYCGINFSGIIDTDLSSLGQSLHTSIGFYDFLISKYDENFNYIFSLQGGSTSWDYIWDISLPSNDQINFLGAFSNTISLDSTQFVSNGLTDGYFGQIIQDTCSTFGISIDSVINLGCFNDGYAIASTLEPNGPVQFLWNSTPTSIDSFATFNSKGIYGITVTDSIGCVRNREVLINGPSSTSQFDLISNLVQTNFRSGLSSNIWLNGYNYGCVPTSGTLSCVLNSLVNYNYSIPPPDLISGDTLFWNFTNLIYDSLHITHLINVTTIGQIGDTVCFTVMINPISGDADSSNNYKTYCFPVVNGYDPNDKQVYPQGECIPNYVLNGEPLTYTVRFQNTGNADAINIHILDTLDSDLDLNSLRVIGNSHYLITEILPGNVLKFRFDNIHLPDSGTNEILSHGYVIYEVKPLAGTPDYTLIENTSHIYFDFNPAIITNTTGNTLIDSIPTFSTVENISVCYDSDYTLPDGTVYSNIILPISHQSNLWMVDGCDSIITTNISSLPAIDTAISLNGITITANASGLNYQWINCTTGLPIGIATQSFTPTVNGEFSVIVSNGTCSDTSACVLINTIGIDENPMEGLNIYPNPAKNILIIEQKANSRLTIEIHNIEGRLLQSFTSNEKNIQTDVSGFANGMYFIHVKSESGNAVYKLVKE